MWISLPWCGPDNIYLIVQVFVAHVQSSRLGWPWRLPWKAFLSPSTSWPGTSWQSSPSTSRWAKQRHLRSCTMSWGHLRTLCRTLGFIYIYRNDIYWFGVIRFVCTHAMHMIVDWYTYVYIYMYTALGLKIYACIESRCPHIPIWPRVIMVNLHIGEYIHICHLNWYSCEDIATPLGCRFLSSLPLPNVPLWGHGWWPEA